MLGWIEILVFAIAGALLLMIALPMMDAHVMPFACPACAHGGDEALDGTRETWYAHRGAGRVYCERCGARFKEHPNGSLVRDRATDS